jgi:hypothetical protein
MSRLSNNINDRDTVTDRVVFLTGTGTVAINRELHANRHLVINGAAGTAGVDITITYTLPPAVGNGDTFKFFNPAARTTASLIFSVASTADVVTGGVAVLPTAAAATDEQFFFSTNATTVTLNCTTTGGLGGDWLEFVDVAAHVWHLRGAVHASGNQTTPFA